MAIKTYIRGFERLPIDTLRYAASTNLFLASAQALADFVEYVDMTWVPYNSVIDVVVVYSDAPISSSYLSASGGSLSGDLNMTNHNITNVNGITANTVTWTNATLQSGTFYSTGLFMSLNVNGSAIYIPTYKPA